jgi:hypothetical protein
MGFDVIAFAAHPDAPRCRDRFAYASAWLVAADRTRASDQREQRHRIEAGRWRGVEDGLTVCATRNAYDTGSSAAMRSSSTRHALELGNTSLNAR